VEVYTGSESSTEMNGNVYITLIGDRGDTGKRKLLRPVSFSADQPFRPNQVRSFALTTLLHTRLYLNFVTFHLSSLELC